jgi:3-hydroxybutyryl-CoA dehydrogenase
MSEISTVPGEFAKIGVIGYGTMGTGITEVLRASGREVVVLESDPHRVDTATAANIIATTDVNALADVGLVIEAVTESVEVKRAVLGEVAAVVGDTVPIVTNTSALSVTELAAALAHPERVAGLHFANPAPSTRTVEVIPALQTDAELIDRLVAFVDTLGDKEPVVVKDRPGFLIGSMLMPYLNDVIAEYDDGLATAEDIDLALRLGLGYKSGPLEMLDRIGLDTHLQATEAAYAATGDERYAPPPLLRQMVAAGRLGDKNGNGFRDHSTDDGGDHTS